MRGFLSRSEKRGRVRKFILTWLALPLLGCHSAPPPVASPTPSATLAAATPISFPPHALKLVNKKSGKIIGVEGSSTDASAKLRLVEDERKADQRWLLTSLPPEPHVSNPATCVQFRNVGSGFSIGARFQTHINGCELAQYDQPAVFETWELEPVESGYYHLRNRSSQKVMAVEGGSVDNGAKIVQWDMIPSAEDQKWKLEEER